MSYITLVHRSYHYQHTTFIFKDFSRKEPVTSATLGTTFANTLDSKGSLVSRYKGLISHRYVAFINVFLIELIDIISYLCTINFIGRVTQDKL